MPFYYGLVDARDRIAVDRCRDRMYVKEACVRAETDELVVLAIGDSDLAEIGRVVVGSGDWFGENHQRYGLFDPRDPDHYSIRLAPRIQNDGAFRFEIAEKHMPAGLRDRPTPCGDWLDFADQDGLLKLVGKHALRDVMTSEPASE